METFRDFSDKAFSDRRVICYFDGYECFRNLCCHSRFRFPFRCSRFVVSTHFRHTYPSVKVDLQYRSGVDV